MTVNKLKQKQPIQVQFSIEAVSTTSKVCARLKQTGIILCIQSAGQGHTKAHHSVTGRNASERTLEERRVTSRATHNPRSGVRVQSTCALLSCQQRLASVVRYAPSGPTGGGGSCFGTTCFFGNFLFLNHGHVPISRPV